MRRGSKSASMMLAALSIKPLGSPDVGLAADVEQDASSSVSESRDEKSIYNMEAKSTTIAVLTEAMNVSLEEEQS